MREVVENACGILVVAIVLVAFSTLQEVPMISKQPSAALGLDSVAQWVADRK
jgi:hypothetical protein